MRARLAVVVALATLVLAGGAAAGQPAADGPGGAQARGTGHPGLVDVNSAGIAELKMLPGIGDAEAARIVAGRPYPSKASLISNHVIPAGVYQSIRHRIIAIQHRTH